MADYKTGINVTYGGSEGTDYGIERLYYDPLTYDAKIVYIAQATDISMAFNDRSVIVRNSTDGGRTIVSAATMNSNGSVIRYKLDRDWNIEKVWADTTSYTATARLLPAYSAPFALEDLEYESGVPVVGTTGGNGGTITDTTDYYYRGVVDSVGDEWHTLNVASDANVYLRTLTPSAYDFSFDGNIIFLVVNPKTPLLSCAVTGTGQFYSTPPKAYWTPKICDQTTYLAAGASGTVTITLRDINGNNVFYRINGGSFTDAGMNFVTLDQDDFDTGSNTLEYYYAGNAAYTKTRTVVKDPAHPSAGETHGYFLFGDADGVTTVSSRVTRAPYKSTYDGYKTSGNFSGQDKYDTWGHQGYRNNSSTPTGYLQDESYSLRNALVAKLEGFTHTLSAKTFSSGQYAIKMLLENARAIAPLGTELSGSSDKIPSRELNYRGYYDAKPTLDDIFAYDIIVGFFRDDQVTGGITAIENYLVRDFFGNFAYEAMQWGQGFNSLGSPMMWGGAKMMLAQVIGVVMKDYSTPYYGTSGWGVVQTTYPLCPYLNDELTWKEALFDGTATKTAWPNLTYYTGISDNGNNSLLVSEGYTSGGHSYSEGDWIDKAAYFSTGLMGKYLQIWANVMKRNFDVTDARLEIAIENATAGNFIGAKDPYPQTPDSVTMIYVLNEYWPNAAANQTAAIQALSSTDNDSDDKAINALAIPLYDDTYFGPAGADTTPPTPSTSTWSVAPFASGDGIAGTATTATDASSSPVAYRFSVVTTGSAESWGPWQELDPAFVITGLTASSDYDVRTQARDSAGNVTTASTIATVKTNAANTRTFRSPRLRGLRTY